MYGFCYHYNKKNDTEQINRFFDLFYKKYLHYSNRNFLDLHDIFNNMSKLWFEDYPVFKEISPEQKILEVLAINSPLTVNELINKTKLDINTINKILFSHTTEFFISTILPSIENQDYSTIDKKSSNKLYSLFLRYNLIKEINDNNNIKYVLSLFGVILTLKLIRYYNIKHKENHYFNPFTFIDYFEKIIKNYSTEIPLIFGKWNTLKKILKNYAIYNFDLIIDPIDSFKENQISISLGGSKEFYYGIKEIILQTRQQIGEFVNMGFRYRCDYLLNSNSDPNKKIQNEDYLSKNFPIAQGEKDLNTIFYLQLKNIQIEKVLNPLELGNTNISMNLNRIFDRYNRTSSEIKIYEKMFVEEISAIYYFNLYNMTLSKIYHSLLDDKSYKQILNIKPKECLSQIRITDDQINNFYLKWKKDIIILYQNIVNNLNNLFD